MDAEAQPPPARPAQTQDQLLLRLIRDLPLPGVIRNLIAGYSNDINVRGKARCRFVIERLAISRVAEGEKTLRDLIHASVYSTEAWAWNACVDGSLMWRHPYPPTPIQREQAILETGLDFGGCEFHPRYRECDETCRNGRNLERAGVPIRILAWWCRDLEIYPRTSVSTARLNWTGFRALEPAS